MAAAKAALTSSYGSFPFPFSLLPASQQDLCQVFLPQNCDCLARPVEGWSGLRWHDRKWAEVPFAGLVGRLIPWFLLKLVCPLCVAVVVFLLPENVTWTGTGPRAGLPQTSQ